MADEFSHIKTSDRQFGFKQGVGCMNSIHNVQKVIKYFNARKTTVNVGVIDLRKAFHKANVFGILCLLYEKNVNRTLINILENWLLKGQTCIKWGKSLSEFIHLQSGVRQGGVLSPFLFSIYVNVVLEQLEKISIGCYAGA